MTAGPATGGEQRRTPRALLFVLIKVDFDRVFAAWRPLSALSGQEFLARAAPDEYYARHERGECDAATYFRHVRDRLELHASIEQIAAGWNAVFVDIIEETLALVRVAAQCVPCFALSNSNPTHEAVWRAQYAAVLEPMTRVFVSSTVGARKPEPAAYRAVSAATGIALADMLFFDDGRDNVKGAQAVGLSAVLVRTPDDVRHALVAAGVIAPQGQAHRLRVD